MATRTKSSTMKKAARGGTTSRHTTARSRIGEPASSPSPVQMLEQQHRIVEGLFEQMKTNRRSRGRLFDALLTTLAIHYDLEEKLFYLALKKRQTEEILLEAVEEHLGAKRLLADLIDLSPRDPKFMAKVEVLRVLVEHHVHQEESEILPMANRILTAQEQERLAQQMTELEQNLLRGGDVLVREEIVEHTDEAAPI